ncbi:hypothetical protein [Paraburkholderia antibiotica]|uniref:Uncharacterized protein n=1 Tax=Paraburkholderia antibiotica TaxID=2728839 RepID=A0A7Y0A305_9BURK|nr:hypothetical protein [Paraburkholderia antibiotica]NML35488.1 hypothetical protein [Paraburkholderia antibiotica]
MKHVDSISKVITDKPTLPNRFISEDYDRFLFFDFFLRENFEFFKALQDATVHRQGIDVYCANTLSLLTKIYSQENWAERFEVLDDELANAGNPFGLIVASSERRWVMVQDIPVNWGILAFRSDDAEMMSIFEALKGDWFLSLGDFVEAQHDPRSVLREAFDGDFINQIVRNYGV